jgi:hypothetical protein
MDNEASCYIPRFKEKSWNLAKENKSGVYSQSQFKIIYSLHQKCWTKPDTKCSPGIPKFG